MHYNTYIKLHIVASGGMNWGRISCKISPLIFKVTVLVRTDGDLFASEQDTVIWQPHNDTRLLGKAVQAAPFCEI